MILAVVAWTVSFACLFASGLFFYRREAPAGLAITIILFVQVHARPLLFFLGLDSPAPYHFFDPDPWALVATGLLLSAFWIAGLTAAYAASSAFAPAGLLPQAPQDCSFRLIVTLSVAVSLVAIVANLFLVFQHGSLAKFVFAVKVGKDLAGSYAIREIAVLASVLTMFALFVSEARFRHFAHRTRRWRGASLGLLALVLANFAVNYLWGNRYNIAVLILAFAVGWHFYVRRFRAWELLVLGVLVVAALKGLKDVRWMLLGAAVGRENISDDFTFWHSLSLSLHLAQFDAFLLAIRDAGESFEFRDGRDFLNGLLSWIPRFIYPEKEVYHIGGWFRRLYEPDKVNGWPITVIGAWYINFGFIGVAIGAVLSGFVAAAIDKAYSPISQSAWAAAVGPAVAFLMLDGGLDFGFFQRIVLLLVPLHLCAWLLGFGRSASPAVDEPDARAV